MARAGTAAFGAPLPTRVSSSRAGCSRRYAPGLEFDDETAPEAEVTFAARAAPEPTAATPAATRATPTIDETSRARDGSDPYLTPDLTTASSTAKPSQYARPRPSSDDFTENTFVGLRTGDTIEAWQMRRSSPVSVLVIAVDASLETMSPSTTEASTPDASAARSARRHARGGQAQADPATAHEVAGRRECGDSAHVAAASPLAASRHSLATT